MPEHKLPTEQEVLGWIRDRRNWGRWGKDDQVGAINLITPAKRAAAARLVRTGRSLSLSRPFPKDPGRTTTPAHHFMRTHPRGKGGFSATTTASTITASHPRTSTPSVTRGTTTRCGTARPEERDHVRGARFGAVEHWAEGIMPCRHARRAAASRCPLCHARPAGARLGARRHPHQARHHARAR